MPRLSIVADMQTSRVQTAEKKKPPEGGFSNLMIVDQVTINAGLAFRR
jgi:hypothetical protein